MDLKLVKSFVRILDFHQPRTKKEEDKIISNNHRDIGTRKQKGSVITMGSL